MNISDVLMVGLLFVTFRVLLFVMTTRSTKQHTSELAEHIKAFNAPRIYVHEL